MEASVFPDFAESNPGLVPPEQGAKALADLVGQGAKI
jgi:hypothetical protein